MRSLLIAAVVLAALPSVVFADIDRTTHLYDVSVQQAADGSPNVSIFGDNPMRYESFMLDSPPRLVVDLPGTVHQLDRTRYDVQETGVVQMRTAQFQTEPYPVARVVFDLDYPLAYEIEQTPSGLLVSFGARAELAAVVAEQMPDWTAAPAPVPASEEPAVTEESNLPVAQPELTAPAVEEPSSSTTPWRQTPAATTPEPAPVDEGAWGEQTPTDANNRVIGPDAIDRLLASQPFAAPEEEAQAAMPKSFASKKISDNEVVYTGKRISLNFVDADIKQVFRLFHEISGINFVLDPSVSGRVTIAVDNVPWDLALDLILQNNGLDKVLDNNVIRIASTAKLAKEASDRKALKEAQMLEVPAVTMTRTLSYAKAKDVEGILREGGVLSTRGSAIVDERTNTVIIRDIPMHVEAVDRLISTLDAETPQVMIEARVVETSRDFVQDLGVVWGMNAIADASRGTQTGIEFPNNASVGYQLNLPGAGGASNLAFKFGNILDSFTLDVALNTLETEGQGRILSSPKIATQNNERAEIEQGVRIPVVNTTATEINVEFVSASLRLEVTPQITAENTIILDIVVENNSPDFVNTVGDVPPINTQRAQTKLLITDGGTTVIGGIFTVNEGRSETGVPWFRKIPLFGWLFKTQNITQQNRELLIFITPKIMKLS